MTFNLITIGDATVDSILVLDDKHSSCVLNKKKNLLCLHSAEKIYTKNSDQTIGGGATNVAVGATLAGLNTAIVTEVGDDINGHAVSYELQKKGVDTRFVKILKGKQTRYSMILNFKGERTILSSYADRKYSLPKLPHTNWIYYTSLGHSFAILQKQLVSYLNKHKHTKLALNPGSYQLKHGIIKMKKILPRVDILFVNKEEAQKIIGKKASLSTCFKKLQKFGVRTPVITDNTNGAYTIFEGNIYHMPVYPITAKAKTGAGDAFATGFLTALHYKKSILEAMQWGTANAGCVIQEFGAQCGLASKRKIQNTIKKYKRITPKTFS